MPNNESVYAPPKSQIIDEQKTPPLSADGNYVVTKLGVNWPDRCYRCNKPATKRFKITLHFQPLKPLSVLALFTVLFMVFHRHLSDEAILFLACVLIVLLLLLSLVFVKKNTIEVGICRQHERYRRLFVVTQWLTPVLLMLAGLAARYEMIISACFTFFLAFALVLTSASLHQRLRPFRHQDGLFWIKGTGQAFRDSLPPFY